MTQFTVEDRFAIYRAITFAQIAADAALFIWRVGDMALDATTRAAVDRVKQESYYAAAWAWNAQDTHIDIERERSAIDADLAEVAALDAMYAALDDLDPSLIAQAEKGHSLVRSKDKDMRADIESIYERYIEAYNYEGAVFDEDHVEAGALLPDEKGLTALYEQFMTDHPHIFLTPFSLHAAAESVAHDLRLISERLGKPIKAEYIAHRLAKAAAPSKGESGVCRYCNNTFLGYCAESHNKGVCCDCDKSWFLSMMQGLKVILAYNPLTGEYVEDTDTGPELRGYHD
jgi:hypothetical protein